MYMPLKKDHSYFYLNLNRKKPKKANYIKLLSLFAPLLGAIAGVVLGYAIYATPDFSISIDKLYDAQSDDVSVMANISIKNVHWVPLYNYPVVLIASSYNDSLFPFPVKIKFDPVSSQKLPMESKMNITGQHVPEGTYEIKISAIGGDGKERNCPFILTVRKYKPTYAKYKYN
jgi:hypothetical protein